MRTPLRILFVVFFQLTSTACIWDAESLSREKSRSHDLAQTILGAPQVSEDTNKLQTRIKDLEANRQEHDPNWWNNLAGAYLRLNESQKAVDLLEPVAEKFPNDYGIHANLGTAYHLLGRYQDAEKEIARDLEINPGAHFGLEKYHLALLQYLVRDQKYQSRHLYVDEFTAAFLANDDGSGYDLFYDHNSEDFAAYKAKDYNHDIAAAEADYRSLVATNAGWRTTGQTLGAISLMDAPPPYRSNWNLREDTNFDAGVIYMGQMNPKEPACFTMLGITAWSKRDYHLAVSAFEKAIALGSPQSELLKRKTDNIKELIARSEQQKRTMDILLLFGASVFCLVIFGIIRLTRGRRHG
jgi:tetratricopeptide (TPR) repeat protein